jgi:DNA invertase Pin-like site-specific DNA recombinase
MRANEKTRRLQSLFGKTQLSSTTARVTFPAEATRSAKIVDAEQIDAELGVSGRIASARSGFKELVGRVCVGEVGAILGLEVSRLARSSADLQRLLELCAPTDTLIIDSDGIYDLSSFNDRLLLGLKGTMSEAELHLLAGRLQGAKLAAAQRGELRFPLPVGYAFMTRMGSLLDPRTGSLRRVPREVRDLTAAARNSRIVCFDSLSQLPQELADALAE